MGLWYWKLLARMAFLPWAFAIHINTFTSEDTLVCKFSCWKVPTLLSYFSVLPYHLTGIYLCQKPLSKLIFDLWRKKAELPMFFLALRSKYIFSTIPAVLITSLTNTITIVYVAEAYHKIHSTCVAVFPAAQMQGVEVQGRTGTFQWILVHNLLSAFFTVIRWCWSCTKVTLKCFCSTWSLYYLKIWGKPTSRWSNLLSKCI